MKLQQFFLRIFVCVKTCFFDVGCLSLCEFLCKPTGFYQGCGPRTRNLGSSFRFRHVKFLAPAPAQMISSIANQKPLLYLYNLLAPQTRAVEPEPNFQASTPPSKSFWL